jgi:hypothetical protein
METSAKPVNIRLLSDLGRGKRIGRHSITLEKVAFGAFQTAASLPPAKGVTLAGCSVPSGAEKLQ